MAGRHRGDRLCAQGSIPLDLRHPTAGFCDEGGLRLGSGRSRLEKKTDFSKVEFFTYDEGLCVQCLHIGPYDDEPNTVEQMHQYMEEQGYTLDISDQRLHHEIYLSDARKVAPEKLKTVIRHPIRKG